MLEGLRTGDRQMMRELNTSIVIDCIRRQGPLPRTDVADITGLGRSTVSGIVKQLLDKRIVSIAGTRESNGGRRAELLSFCPDCYNAIGIKVQPDAVLACLTNLNGEVAVRHHVQLGDRSLANVLSSVEQAVEGAISGVPADRILGMGVGVPGLVDPQGGKWVKPHFFDFNGLALSSVLEDMLGFPVLVDNDARVGALGEKWARQGAANDSFLFITLGIGVGGSVVLDGKLITGELIGAGHIGHTFVEPAGPVCRCGQVGCLEMVASDAALARFAQKACSPANVDQLATDAAISRDQIYAAAKANDPGALEVVDRQCGYVSIAVANVIKLLGIRRVIVGGEAALSGGAFLLHRLAEQLKRRLPDTLIRDEVEVLPSSLGNDVWQVGAAALVLEDVFRAPIYGSAPQGLGKVAIS